MAKSMKKLQKEIERQNALREVRAHEARLDGLVTLHATCRPAVDWRAIATRPAPEPPTYSPTLFDRWRGREALESPSHQRKVEAYDQARFEWKARVDQARAIMAREPDAIRTVIEAESPFTAVIERGAKVQVLAISPSMVEVVVTSFAADVVPTVEKHLLSSGRLSTRAMSKTRLHSVMQDYMCSAALRSTRELMSLLPIERVLVHVDAEFLDTSIGHYVERTMVSAIIDRTTLDVLNFERIDPSDAMSNFNHAMNRATSRGIRPVDRFEGMAVALPAASTLDRHTAPPTPPPPTTSTRRHANASAPRADRARAANVAPAPEDPRDEIVPEPRREPRTELRPEPRREPRPEPPRGPHRVPPPECPRGIDLPAKFRDSLDEKTRQAFDVLVVNSTVSTSELGQQLSLSAARVGGLMRKLKQRARDEGISLFDAEPLPNGERQYRCASLHRRTD